MRCGAAPQYYLRPGTPPVDDVGIDLAVIRVNRHGGGKTRDDKSRRGDSRR